MKKLVILVAVLLAFNASAAKKKSDHKPKPSLPESSIFVIDQNTNNVVLEKNSNLIRPMASITKLMTAIVVLDQNPIMSKKIPTAYSKNGRVVKEQSIQDLFTLMLVKSDNSAAETLSKSFFPTRKQFIEAMNEKSVYLGMLTAYFADPTGISAENSASAQDVAKLVAAAGIYPEIRSAASLKNFELAVNEGSKKKQTVVIRNTNYRILFEFDNIKVSKTGFTSRAGRCLALLVEQQGNQYAIVILGQPDPIKRDAVARDLINNHLN
jgi:D-alanyl-D-alanine endopeptidase (penicillin-binding protein 7)